MQGVRIISLGVLCKDEFFRRSGILKFKDLTPFAICMGGQKGM